jgi:hypothetical protein
MKLHKTENKTKPQPQIIGPVIDAVSRTNAKYL